MGPDDARAPGIGGSRDRARTPRAPAGRGSGRYAAADSGNALASRSQGTTARRTSRGDIAASSIVFALVALMLVALLGMLDEESEADWLRILNLAGIPTLARR